MVSVTKKNETQETYKLCSLQLVLLLNVESQYLLVVYA